MIQLKPALGIRRHFVAVLALVGTHCVHLTHTYAEDQGTSISTGLINAVTLTMGGVQFWGDELCFHDWRIQRNAMTGHYRLLDGKNSRYAWGTFDECRNKLEKIKRERNLPAMKGKAVIVLHGLFRTRNSMEGMGDFLQQNSEYQVFCVGYPSTRADIDLHAANLAKVIDSLDGIEEINFVAHSLGNLVIRRYLNSVTDPAAGKMPDPRIKRMVMLGAPNNGATIARKFGRNSLFRMVVGQSGTQLAERWEETMKNLATPACEFAVIAGGKGDGEGYNPLLPGDDDAVVTVEETRLPGAADFNVLPIFHSFMMDDETIQQRTLSFLRNGYLISPDKRVPITASAE